MSMPLDDIQLEIACRCVKKYMAFSKNNGRLHGGHASLTINDHSTAELAPYPHSFQARIKVDFFTSGATRANRSYAR